MDESIGFLDTFPNNWICKNCGKSFHEDFRKYPLRNNQNKTPEFCCIECLIAYRSKDKFDILTKWKNGEDVSSEMSISHGKIRFGDLSGFFWKHCRDILMEEQGNKCSICGATNHWNNKPLIFVLDHIDGDYTNQRKVNLRMVCPNCNSQLDTSKNRPGHSGRRIHKYGYNNMKEKMGIDSQCSLSEEELAQRRDIILACDRSVHGWQTKLAKELGVHRTTVRRTMDKLNIN